MNKSIICLSWALTIFAGQYARSSEPVFEFGFGKADITPAAPMRLSGYGNRTEVSEGVDTKLFTRAMAIRDPQGRISVLVAVDTIGFSGALTKLIAERIDREFDIPRSQFVICCSHSHTAPHLSTGLENILAKPLTESEAADARDYTDRLADQVMHAVKSAIDDLRPGVLAATQGKVTFARNRRVIQDGRWTGFGVTPAGPVDHALSVLRITDPNGSLRGVVFNYACHCTTFGGGYNRVNGDWAGYASAMIETEHPGSTALCSIGCGADQNPVRHDDAATALQLAQSHGKEIAAEVRRLLADEWTEITSTLKTSFGYAGLPFDRPTVDELKQAFESRQVQARRHAQNMLAVHERMGRLPETYPAPVQAWRFGDQLCMVFLGGEVVVDYALRLKHEIDCGLVWTSAYCNDVFAYVASDRIVTEGGYEATGSMIYYNQPGPWEVGVEEVLIRRVHELVEEGSFGGPLTPEEALKTFRTTGDFRIEIVAAEPLIADPVNIAAGADGRLWVVEMGDYPRGTDGQGAPGGRVKILSDHDHDGQYDSSEVFLDGLSYPSGVFPWRDGVLISCAPAILWAKDEDGDDRADVVKELYRGFDKGNPQHRMNGFAYGLDHWLYVAASADNGKIESVRTGEVVHVAAQDFRIQPDRGLIEPVGGHTQFGRNRDDWGNWFGGDNSRPLQHFVVPDRYVRRNPYVAVPDSRVDLLAPAFAPPVFPASRTVDRFNDLFAANRFTSACSPTIFRDSSLGIDVEGAALVCEPVHNLVHRAILAREGLTFRAARHSNEAASEFLTSTDLWFRPVVARTGADGALWIVDMYRHVIEHPEWIPEAWQTQLDLRAGSDKGRIYRIAHRDSRATMPNLAEMPSAQLVAELSHANGWRRDTAQRLLIERRDASTIDLLAKQLRQADEPRARLHALATLARMENMTAEHVLAGLADEDPRVVRYTVQLSEPLVSKSDLLLDRLVQLTGHSDTGVLFQLALTLGERDDDQAAEALTRLALSTNEPWLRSAVLSSSSRCAETVLLGVLRSSSVSSEGRSELVRDLISTALGSDEAPQLDKLLEAITSEHSDKPQTWQIEALAALDQGLRRRHTSLAKLSNSGDQSINASLSRAEQIIEAARQLAVDDGARLVDRVVALKLLGRGGRRRTEDLQRLADLLSPQQPAALQIAAVDSLSQFSDAAIAELMLERWHGLSPQVRSAVLAALLTRSEWVERLVTALENGELRPNDLDAATRDRLTTQGELRQRERVAKALSANGGFGAANSTVRLPELGSLRGNESKGAERFNKVCAACHRHNGIGNDFGPKLAALTDKSDRALLTAVLDPNRAIEEKYLSYTCVTSDGRIISGMILSETANSVTFARADGAKQTVLRVDIEELVSTGTSFMPNGLTQDWNPQDVADLFAFLRRDDREP